MTGPVGGGFATPFVADEVKRTWGSAITIEQPVEESDAFIQSVSCPSAGNCTAAGIYSTEPPQDNPGTEVFVVDQKDGRWGEEIDAPGLVDLNNDQMASVGGISCPSAGNCVVTGQYAVQGIHPYVVAEVGGVWHSAIELPGAAALYTASTTAVSCASVGNCAVGGSYLTSLAATQSKVFVASETNGTWHSAITVPGTSAANGPAAAKVQAVSCSRGGDCVAVGSDGSEFAVTDVNGNWGKAVTIAGMAGISSLSCPANGDCVAGGTVSLGKLVGDTKAAIVTETNGVWGKPFIVPGLTSLRGQQDSSVASVSCSRAGNCTAGGAYQYAYKVPDGGSAAFAVTELNGAWAPLKLIPGLSALTTDHRDAITAVSCTAPATCSAVGTYSVGGGAFPPAFPFVVSETLARVTSTTLALSATRVAYGHEQSERLTVTVRAMTGTPTGKAAVKSGTRTVCVITLKSGKGICTLTARQLKPGTYHLAASYPGTIGFASSTSAPKTLTVAK